MEVEMIVTTKDPGRPHEDVMSCDTLEISVGNGTLYILRETEKGLLLTQVAPKLHMGTKIIPMSGNQILIGVDADL